MLFRQRRSKKHDAADINTTPQNLGSFIPFLQQKSELDGEATQKHELPAEETVAEVAGGHDRWEKAVEGDKQEICPYTSRHEIHGREHRWEMESP